MTDIFCGIKPELLVNGWFADACTRLNAVAKDVSELYPALHNLLAQENTQKVENVRNLLIAISGKTDCKDLWKRFNQYIQELSRREPFVITQQRMGKMTETVLELLCQITDPQLLRNVLADKHDLVLVHAGAAHATHLQRYLETLGHVVTSVHENNAQPDPFNPSYYATPLTPATIQQTLTKAFANNDQQGEASSSGSQS